MTGTLAKHGTQAGYKQELQTGNVCSRCLNAHRVYNSQYSAASKKSGIKYAVHDVIDHLYKPRGVTPGRAYQGRSGASQGQDPPRPPGSPAGAREDDTPHQGGAGLSERLGRLLGARTAASAGDDGYAPLDEDHPYVSPIEPDQPPFDDGQWQPVNDAEFVINAAGMAKIEENLGTYLSVVGMTAEMIDPYCGAIAAENFDNIITKWSKVIAHYPKAAALFLNDTGGILFSWIGALQATWPVLYAFYEHHLSKTVKVEKGVVYRRSGDSQGSAVDPLAPPVPDNFSYSVR